MKNNSKEDVKLQNLKIVLYKNKYFPKEYISSKVKLADRILENEKKTIKFSDNILTPEDEEEIAENVRRELLENEKRRIFSTHQVPKINRKTRKKYLEMKQKVPFIHITRNKLRNMLNNLEKKEEISESQKELKKCFAHMHTSVKPLWTSPCWIMKAINECLLTRNWNTLTYLLLELIHCTNEIYKPIIRNAFNLMDKLHPVIYENDLQGEYKKIRKYHQRILDTTTVV